MYCPCTAGMSIRAILAISEDLISATREPLRLVIFPSACRKMIVDSRKGWMSSNVRPWGLKCRNHRTTSRSNLPWNFTWQIGRSGDQGLVQSSTAASHLLKSHRWITASIPAVIFFNRLYQSQPGRENCAECRLEHRVGPDRALSFMGA